MLQRILLGAGGKRYHQAATPTAKGLLRPNPSRQLVAIHPRHHAVGNHDVEVFALPTFECFLSIFRGGRPVPKAFQLHGQGQTIEWDGLPQARSRAPLPHSVPRPPNSGASFGGLAGRRPDQRKIELDREAGAFARFAAQADPAAHQVYQAPADTLLMSPGSVLRQPPRSRDEGLREAYGSGRRERRKEKGERRTTPRRGRSTNGYGTSLEAERKKGPKALSQCSTDFIGTL